MLKIPKNLLFLFTGLLWLTASSILLSRAFFWSENMDAQQLWIALILGIILAFVKGKLIFVKLTQRNIARISAFGSKVSIWEFHRNRDKILIVLMIFIGVGLRQAPFIPKWVLMPIYLGIGLAMFYVFLLYILVVLRKNKPDTRTQQ